MYSASIRVVIFLVVLAFVGATLLFVPGGVNAYPEVREIEKSNLDFGELTHHLQDLSDRKGAAYAFEVLKRTDVPKNFDLHLLAHFVGDKLYEQKGIEGIKTCTHDFRNACSHSIVVGALLAHGEGSLQKIQKACYEAPGGKGAYTMCFHGLGHGVLAYLNYEFPQAVEFCSRLGTAEYNEREYVECVGGAVMEMVSGIHDKATWEEKASIYLDPKRPFQLCDSNFVPEKVKGICYTYITPQLFDAVGADLGYPIPEDYDAMFEYCKVVSDEELRSTCFGSLGKEFVALARGREIRNVEETTDEEFKTMFEWCELADDPDGVDACVIHSVQSLYWGGENDRSAGIRFCSLILNGQHKNTCFSELTEAVEFYIDDELYKKEYCSELPKIYQKDCKATLQ